MRRANTVQVKHSCVPGGRALVKHPHMFTWKCTRDMVCRWQTESRTSFRNPSQIQRTKGKALPRLPSLLISGLLISQ